MKKILSIMLVTALSVGLVACGGPNNEEVSNNDLNVDNEMVQPTETTDETDSTEGILIDNGGLQVIEFVDTTSDNSKENKEVGYNLIVEDGKTYLTVFLGERNTGGYGIMINEVIANEKELLVSYTEITPAPDDMVTQAFTYPVTTIELFDLETIELEVILQKEDTSDLGDNLPTEEYYISDTDSYAVGEIITVGEIVQFDGDYIHIISGDLVEVFKVNQEMTSNFYLRETVKLVKGKNEVVLESYLEEDFTVNHTNMGHIISVMKGEVLEISEETITILSEKEEVVLSYYDHVMTQVGNVVEVHYMNFDDGNNYSVVSLYNEASEMEMTIVDITRNDFGEMILYTSDNNVEGEEIDYHVTLSQALLKLNLSELKIGDVVKVNADMILESYPAQVAATKLTK